MNIYVEEQEDTGILTDKQDWLTRKQFEATPLYHLYCVSLNPKDIRPSWEAEHQILIFLLV